MSRASETGGPSNKSLAKFQGVNYNISGFQAVQCKTCALWAFLLVRPGTLRQLSCLFSRRRANLTNRTHNNYAMTVNTTSVLYCGRVPVANAPGCTAAEGSLYKPWSLVVPTCTARCLHQRKEELLGREMAVEFCLKMLDFHVTFRDLLHAVKLRHGTNGFTSLPK